MYFINIFYGKSYSSNFVVVCYICLIYSSSLKEQKNYHNNKKSSQNYNVNLTKIKIKLKKLKNRFYNNLLVKKLVGIFKFLFQKQLSINPNQNSIKIIKGKEKTFWRDIKKKKQQQQHNTKTHIKKNKKIKKLQCIFNAIKSSSNFGK